MTMKFVCFFVSLSGFLSVFSCSSAAADFVCTAEISYTWVKTGGDGSRSKQNDGLSAKGAEDGGGETAIATPAPSVVRLGSMERDGPDEATAKERLEVEASRLKVRASEACRRNHESFGTCVTTKFSANGALLNSLGFSARKEVERALTDECRSQRGTCVGVVVTDPQCKERIAAEPTPTAAPDKKGDGKKK